MGLQELYAEKKNIVSIYFNLTLNDKCTLNNYSIKNERKEKKKIIIITLINSTDRFHSRDKNLDNRCYAAILVYRNVNKLVGSFAWNMVLCLIVSCGSKSGRDKGLYFVRVPSVLTNQGEEVQKISEERRSRWISAISRDDLTEEILENDRVCEKHLF